MPVAEGTCTDTDDVFGAVVREARGGVDKDDKRPGPVLLALRDPSGVFGFAAFLGPLLGEGAAPASFADRVRAFAAPVRAAVSPAPVLPLSSSSLSSPVRAAPLGILGELILLNTVPGPLGQMLDRASLARRPGRRSR